MDINIVVAVAERADCRFRLAAVVGVNVSRRAFHVNRFHARAKPDALDEIHGGNDRAAQPPLFAEIGQLRLFSGTPEPCRVCGLQSARPPRLVHGMMIQNLKAFTHQVVEFSAAVPAFRQVFSDPFAENIVRAHKGIGIVAAADHQAVAVADAGVEPPRIVAEFFLQRGNQFGCLGGGNFVGAVVEHDFVVVVLALIGERDHIAAVGGVVGRHFKPHAHRLQRGAPLGVDARIEREDRHVCGVAFRNHALGNIGNGSHQCVLGKTVHHRLFCGFHRRPVSEHGNFFIRHAVGNQYKIFHIAILPVRLLTSLYYSTLWEKVQEDFPHFFESFCEAAANRLTGAEKSCIMTGRESGGDDVNYGEKTRARKREQGSPRAETTAVRKVLG